MVNLIQVEWIKLRKTKGFWWAVLLTPCIIGYFCYLLANGVKTNSNYFSTYHTIFSLVYLFANKIWLVVFGLLLIVWQQQEHKDNTFKLFALIPVEPFGLQLIRFNVFYLVALLTFLLSTMSLIKCFDLSWSERFGDVFSRGERDIINLRVFENAKATAVLSYSVFLCLFIITTKIKEFVYSLIVLLSFLIVSFVRLPDWFFLSSIGNASKYIYLIFVSKKSEYIIDLENLYLFSTLSSVLLIMLVYFLIRANHFFYNKHYVS